MSGSLEDLIRHLALEGELNYLSIIPVAGKGPKDIVFSATYSAASKWGHGIARDADPVEALKKAIADHRVKKTAKAPPPPPAPDEETEPWLK
jgi:hypothetical protein